MILRMIIAGALAAPTLADVASAREPSADEAGALEIYRTIIGMRTAKGHGKVPEMAAYLAGELKSAGFADEDIEIIPVDETAGMVVRYRGDGSSGQKPILFLAHMDVVDANPEDWDHDPFTLREEGGYFFGRGTADNKYGVANLTQSFMRLKRDGFLPTRDLYLVFTGDEETEMATTKMLAVREDLAAAEFALNSDAGGGAVTADGTVLPYFMQSAEKTYASFEITARNPGGHSSRPRVDNAIYDLARALLKIEDYRFPVMSNEVTRAAARADGVELGGDIGKALVAFADDPENKKAIKVLRADDDYAHMLSTTCIATMLDAGHAENALPQAATATVNCRIFPGVKVEEVRQTLANTVDNEALEIAPVDDDYVASPASEPRADVTAALQTALRTRFPKIIIVPEMSSGATDGMHFRRAGVPTYGAGAGFGIVEESANAHGENERMPVDSFFGGLDHWIIMIRELAGPAEQENEEQSG